jgi:hypothetical protein
MCRCRGRSRWTDLDSCHVAPPPAVVAGPMPGPSSDAAHRTNDRGERMTPLRSRIRYRAVKPMVCSSEWVPSRAA